MKKFTLYLFFALPYLLYAQTPVAGDLQTYIEDIISDLPEADPDNNALDDEYTLPTMAQLMIWQNALADLLAGDYPGADAEADMIDYDLTVFTDIGTMEVYYILEKTALGTNYWGTYVFKLDAMRNDLIIMSPHPIKDFRTGKQGIYCFIETDAFAFMLAGTNRCNAATPMVQICSGQTTVCSHVDPGISENYPISDLAHHTESIWQKTTAYLHDEIDGTYFVQLHGFTKKMTDPYVIMSNGTRITPAPDKIATLRDALFLQDTMLTFEIAHIDLAWSRLIGFSNTNGRYINGSVDPCITDATMTEGRFIHIEQEKFRLRNDQAGWDKMAVALSNTFSGLLAAGLIDFSGELTGQTVSLQWRVETEAFEQYEIERSYDGINFTSIKTIFAYHQTDFSFDNLVQPGDNYYRLKMMNDQAENTYSDILHFQYRTSPKIWFDAQSQQIKYSHPTGRRYNFLLYNGLGQLVLNTTSANNDGINVTFPAGIYFYTFYDDQNKFNGAIFLN